MTKQQLAQWSFLTNHARVLLCIAEDPDMRLRDIGDNVGITERAVHRIVVALADAGYISRKRNGRRTRYQVRAHLPLHDAALREQSVGDLLVVLGAGVKRTGAASRRRTASKREITRDRSRREGGPRPATKAQQLGS